jgi:inner membrane protein
MLWKTHIMGGIVAGALLLPYCNLGNVTSQAAFVACAGAGALLPDIDSSCSKLGRMIWPVSKTIQMIFGHRQIFHSLLMAALLYGCLCLFWPLYAIPIIVGFVSHLVLDSFNPEGIAWLYPLPFRVAIPLATTGGIIEKICFLGLTVGAVGLLTNIGKGYF